MASSATDAAVRCPAPGPVETSPARATYTMTNSSESATAQPTRRAIALTNWVRSTSTNTAGRSGSSDASTPRTTTEISTAGRPEHSSRGADAASRRVGAVQRPAREVGGPAPHEW